MNVSRYKAVQLQVFSLPPLSLSLSLSLSLCYTYIKLFVSFNLFIISCTHVNSLEYKHNNGLSFNNKQNYCHFLFLFLNLVNK